MIAKLAIREEGKGRLQLAVNWTILFSILSSLKSDGGRDKWMIIAQHGHHQKKHVGLLCLHIVFTHLVVKFHILTEGVL